MADNSKNSEKTSFFMGVKAEYKKIAWPTKDTLIKETVSVVCVSAVLAVLIALFDTIIQYGINFISTIG